MTEPGSDWPKKGFLVTVHNGDVSRNLAGLLASICVKPSCRCTTVGLEFYPVQPGTEEADWSKPEFMFQVNLDKRALDKSEQQRDAQTGSFARRLVYSLKPEHWDKLWDMFLTRKAAQSEAKDLDGASMEFPVETIENGVMVSYHEVLPFGTGFSLKQAEISLVMEDAYCLRPDCSCSDVGLSFIVVSGGLFKKQEIQSGISYNYKTKKWDLSKAEGKMPLKSEELSAAVEREWPNISLLLQSRHRKLKRFYQRFREAKKQEALDANVEPALVTSRNTPCPCGSGKKYKRCCGKD